jgi:hypothetical protein
MTYGFPTLERNNFHLLRMVFASVVRVYDVADLFLKPDS